VITPPLGSSDAITSLLRRTRRIAVLGIKTEAQSDQPAYYVPRHLADVGFEIVPVPVYYPQARHILNRRVYRRLADVPPPPIDLVNVFRRSEHLMPHLEDIVLARPRVVWLQLGIRHDGFATRLHEEGILVVQDLCLMVEVIKRGIRQSFESHASAHPV
jgi:predicted CoA-binding protein